MEWSILCFFSDFICIAWWLSVKRSKKINKTNKECSILCLLRKQTLSQNDFYIKLLTHEKYFNYFFINFNSLFCLLGLSEGNQKSERQIQKEKLNKAIKSLQKILKPMRKIWQ